MNVLSKFSDVARSPGDPTIIESGPSSRGLSDSAAKGLGWFSIALGLTELLGAERMTKALGMEGKEGLVRAYGARELVSGILCLSVDDKIGAWSRVAGDGLDIATLLSAYNDDNPKKHNVALALAAVASVTLLDLATAQGLTARHSPKRGEKRDYSDRSGFPKGLAAARGAGADFATPDDMKSRPQAQLASPVTGRTSPAAEQLQRTLEPTT
jgi:hypothetical protein